jgi:hypothetical protein
MKQNEGMMGLRPAEVCRCAAWISIRRRSRHRNFFISSLAKRASFLHAVKPSFIP